MFFATVILLASVASACAKTVVITVGGNTTDNPMGVFQPANVTANQGDVVLFNFTQGNHTAVQSTFAGPCIPAHDTNATINGFDSGFRDTVNGTAITTLKFTVTSSNDTIWFFDWNTCEEGGVGGININDSSLETLDGFQRNAMRLNGTDSTISTSGVSSATTTATSSPASTATGSPSSAANRALANGVAALAPFLAIIAAVSL